MALLKKNSKKTANKVGKAKKVKDEEVEVEIEEEEEEVTEAPKKRGRPRKSAEPVEVEVDEEDVASAKKSAKKSAKAATSAEAVHLLPIESIKIHPDIEVEGVDLDNERVEELVKSIATHGLLTPLSVASIGNKYYLVGGRHRKSAIEQLVENKAAAFKRHFKNGIPVVVVTDNVEQAKVLNTVDNLHRRVPNDVEFAAVVNNMIDSGMDTADIAKALKRSQTWVRDHRRFHQEATEGLKARVAAGEISWVNALKIMKQDEDEQDEVAEKVIEKTKGSKHGRGSKEAMAEAINEKGGAVVVKPTKKQITEAYDNIILSILKKQEAGVEKPKYTHSEALALAARSISYVAGEITLQEFEESLMKPKVCVKLVMEDVEASEDE
jgi:ParB family chromosome partitioning protein